MMSLVCIGVFFFAGFLFGIVFCAYCGSEK